MEEAEGLKIKIFINYRKFFFFLIKVVIQTILTYAMSYFLLLMSICEHIKSMLSKFLWDSKQGKHKIHWINGRHYVRKKRWYEL